MQPSDGHDEGGLMSTDQRLVYMANQIARNFTTIADEDAAYAVADHIKAYWDPRMRARILSHGAGLSPVARHAIDLVRSGDASVQHGTAPVEPGPSDAG